jgi:hypothetical protein
MFLQWITVPVHSLYTSVGPNLAYGYKMQLPYTCHGPGTVVHLRMTGIRQGVTIVIFINTCLDQKDLSTYPIQNDSRLLHDGIGRNLKSDVIRHL